MGGTSLSSVWTFLRDAQPVLTFVAGLFSATYISRRTDKLRQLEIARTAAYADFMRGVAGLAIMQRNARCDDGDEEIRKFTILVADAKARIAIYGSNEVAASLAGFFRGGAVLDTPERRESFIAVCEKMRSYSISGKHLANHDLSGLFF